MTAAGTTSPPFSPLSRQHRAWIALYSLDSYHRKREEVLRVNDITEEDLQEFEESWLKLRCRPAGVVR
ncbi:hypothetical protein KBK19_16470 [Microvirga sp. STR05]|uniref:DUF1127 domain-containing protein n=1 Tax=Hymenobacter duratus TaxID=2771356 RepID=A0ABR8JIH3_9BACT|nr:hypothetical protein [Hymenobacter duratus]MBD2716640.1 hypothetical protein [Hymenobacter duratus]MBR7951555.1 hypothetical protein [Microvirga sp. STR05]